jgi:uncharacterized membrane protein
MFGIPLHFLFVHFPIALSLLAIMCDLRGQHDTGYRLTGWGAVAAGLAVLTGLQMGSGVESAESILHVGSALLGTLCLIALAVLRYSARAREEDVTDSYPTAWLLVGLLAGVAIAMAAITGHRFGRF